MAGYSKKSLVEKLGIKTGQKVYLGNAPQGYENTLGSLPDGVILAKSRRGSYDLIQFFTTERAELESMFPELKESLLPNGSLWISWPKGAAKIKTDVNETVVRKIGLENGLVDVKVCAVDDVWSGLKFVYRLKDRA